jgi:hypothetical protein
MLEKKCGFFNLMLPAKIFSKEGFFKDLSCSFVGEELVFLTKFKFPKKKGMVSDHSYKINRKAEIVL